MAKKVLTPEEVQAKLEKRSNKRKLFFGTFTKALAFFLAIAMAYSLATIAFVPETAPVATGSAQGGASTGTPADNGDGNLFGNDDPAPAPSDDGGSASTGNDDPAPASSDDGSSASTGTSTGSGSSASAGASTGNTQQPAKQTLADALKAVNDATAKAAKASYNWKRTGEFTKDIDLGSKIATNMVDGIIKAVDKNATLNSVVGGFIGVGNKENTVTNGKPGEGMEEKYLLKATTLQASDIQSWKVDGNKYMLQIKNCQTPKAGSAMDHATNDYITVEEINTTIAGFTDKISVKDSSTANYTKIVLVATVNNGQLTNMTISYTLDAKLDLSIGFTGTGAGDISAEYSNFKY